MMDERVRIREAVAGDAAKLQRCMHSAYSAYTDRFGEIRLPPLDADYSAEIRDFPTWVVELDEDLVGGLIMTFGQDHALVSNVAVHPDFQGKGLGVQLMRFAEARARERRLSELRLVTHVLLTENVAFYLKLGWVEIERDDVGVYMRKVI
jgi:GNAT superfamily N-acetyltransferase